MRFLFTWFQTQLDESFESGLPFEQRISWGKSSFLPLKVCELVSLRFIYEMILLFGKISTVGSRKYDYSLGCGVFFSIVHYHLGLFSVSTFTMFISQVNVQFLRKTESLKNT